jgi:AmmeMemoRadiSam system protein A
MTDSTEDGMRLNRQERDFLRELAGLAIAAAAHNTPPPNPAQLAALRDLDLDGRLSARRGAFVTLTIGGRLRGCIGYIEGIKPLVEAVIDNGRAAAVGDPRFGPVQEAELAALEWEISALTPLRPVDDIADIRIGAHGILLSKNGRQAVFLPQVATEQGWDLETTLTQLAAKAGLAPDAWASGAEFQVFEAEVF